MGANPRNPPVLTSTSGLAVANFNPVAIRRLTLLGFLLAVVVVALLIWLWSRAHSELLRNEQEIALSYQVQAEIDEMQYLAAEAESEYRGFVFTGDALLLSAFERTAQRLPEARNTLERNLHGANVAALIDVRNTLAANLAVMHRAVDLRRSKGERPAREYLDSDALHVLHTRLRDQLEVLDVEQEQRAQSLKLGRDARQQHAWGASALLLASLVATLVLLYRMIRRSQRGAYRALGLYGALSATNEAIVRAEDPSKLLNAVCRILVDQGGMSMAWVGRLDYSGLRVEMVASYGSADHYRDGYSFSLDPSLPEGRGYVGEAIRTREVQIANDLSTDPRIALWREKSRWSGFLSKALVPVTDDGGVAFTLQLYSNQPGFFDQEMAALLTRLGNDVSFALENLRRKKERELAVTALAASEERFQLAVRGTNDGIFDWDITTGTCYFSPRYEQLLGYQEHELEPKRSTFEEHLHPDDRDRTLRALRDHLERQVPYRQVEYRLRSRSGEFRWFQADAEASLDTQGKPVRFSGAMRDVTARKAVERQLERTSNLYNALSQTNKAIVHIKEPQPLFEAICRIAVDNGHLRGAWIGMVDEATRLLMPVAVVGTSREEVEHVLPSVDPGKPEGRGLAGTAIREQRAQVANDFLNDPRTGPWRDWAARAGFLSIAAFPLRRGETAVGALILYGAEVGFFTDELVALLAEMAMDISFALDNLQREAERECAQRGLRESEEKFRQLASNIPEVFWIAEPGFARITYVSSAYERVWGRSAERLLEHPLDWTDAIHPADRDSVEQTVRTAFQGRVDHEYRILQPNGEIRWIHDRAFPVMNELGEVVRLTGIAEDITSRKEVGEQLLYLAHYDNLTQLPNRVLFYDRLKQSIARSTRDGLSVAVMFVDLDRFKLVNDTLGHTAGDRLLQLVAQRMGESLRSGDTVARLGGDEFAVIVSDLACVEDAAQVAQKLIQVLEAPFKLAEQEVFVTASVGISLYPADSNDPDLLIGSADAAMYRAKDMGRSQYQFYKAEMNVRSRERLSLENHLRRALERGEFELHYQPKAGLGTGEITGFEALLRWNHPELGIVPPVKFIHILEDNGLIVPVGEWVLATAAHQIKAWNDAGLKPLPVAVNLSGRQLSQKDLDRRIKRILSEAGVDPRLVELEITESVLMRNAELSVGILRSLKQLDIRLSVDDFGTGYSSLSYLKTFPLDALKIDRSFVKDVISNPDDALITRAIISLAHSLRLKVVAEGVETEAQLTFLAANGCDEMQGYYFSRPVPAAECERLQRERKRVDVPVRATQTAGQRTLLLVDDEPNVLSALTRLLRPDGYRILSAVGAAEALDLLAKHEVDVVISDQRMPGMTGTELLHRVRELYPDTVRMVLSGYLEPQAIADAINRGAVYKFLTKPWDNEELSSIVKNAFAQKAELDKSPAAVAH